MSQIKGLTPLAPFLVEHTGGVVMVFIDFKDKFFTVQDSSGIRDWPSFKAEMEDLIKNHPFANWPKVDISVPEELSDIVEKADDKLLEARDKVNAC